MTELQTLKFTLYFTTGVIAAQSFIIRALKEENRELIDMQLSTLEYVISARGSLSEEAWEELDMQLKYYRQVRPLRKK